MGKASKWLKRLLSSKKDKITHINYVSEDPTSPTSNPSTTPKRKRKWSFRRSSCTSTPPTTSPPSSAVVEAAADAVAETAAKLIQSVFRLYLNRKAQKALEGIMKLQALVRGHIVRRRASVTLKCMEALIAAQARARAHRIRMLEDSKHPSRRQSPHRRSTTSDHRLRHEYNHEIDSGLMEENIKIVEMDIGDSKGSLTDINPRVCSGRFEYTSFNIAETSPRYYVVVTESYDPLCPSYMANTESSRAKLRAQSASRSRLDSIERQPSYRRRASMEGRNHVPKAMKTKRSSLHVGAAAEKYKHPWSIKLSRSTASL